MSNLSDSDNFNNDNNVLKIDASKRRGRPKKGFFTEKPKQSNSSKEFNNNEKDLILHLPVKLVKKDKNNDEEEKKQNEENNKKYENINKIKSDDLLSSFDSDSIKSDDDYDSTFDYNDDEDENSKNNDNDTNKDNNSSKTLLNYKKKYLDLLEKYKEKEIELNKYKNKSNINAFEPNIYKEIINHVIDLQLVNKDTNKIIDINNNKSVCWWCTYDFNTTPCFIPEKYYNEKYYVFGCFCSFNCAAAYNLELSDYKIHERYALLKKLYLNLKDGVDNIAPKREILEKYGGVVSIEQYRNNFKLCNRDYVTKLPPIIFLNHIIDEVIIEKSDISETQNINNLNSLKKKLPKNNLFSFKK